MTQGETDVVEAFEQSVSREIVHGERDFDADLGCRHQPAIDVHRDLQGRVLGHGPEQRRTYSRVDLDGYDYRWLRLRNCHAAA